MNLRLGHDHHTYWTTLIIITFSSTIFMFSSQIWGCSCEVTKSLTKRNKDSVWKSGHSFALTIYKHAVDIQHVFVLIFYMSTLKVMRSVVFHEDTKACTEKGSAIVTDFS